SEERSLLFDGLANLVEFGRAKTSEGLGGLMTPDSPIALITRKFGPVGDKKQTIDDFRAAMGIGPSSIPSNGAAVTPYSTVRAHAIANGPNVSGAINLGIKDLLGDDAEIVPGIKITDIVNFILKSGDDQGGAAFQAFTNAPIPQEASASENAMQWQTRVTGIDWIYSLIGSSPGQITVSDAISLLLSQPIPDVGGEPLQFGAESSLYWVTEDFKELDAGVFTFAPENRSAKSGPNRSQFSVDALASINFLEPKPVIKAKSELSNFSITFLKALTVNFNYVRFEISELGKKEFTPSIGDVRFSGPLAFIDGLRELLKDLEDQFGLQIDVTPQRVSVSQIIAFPPSGPSVINLGPATIANLNFNWGVVIPIIGRDKMRVTAGLASRESPMVIAVGIYGGRSYAIFEADTSGPRLIEVSCDFGGVFEAEWSGVVRGSMSLTAGFAFVMRWDGNNQQSIELIAFSQFSGKLSVISLISVCANIYVALGYKTGAEGRVIYGIARASVSFKIVIKKYRVEWETYHEEVRKESSGNNGRSQRPRIYDYGDGSISNDQSSLRLNAAHVGAGFDGRAIPEQSESVDYFYPFGDSRMKKHWEDFFGAFKTS
ncbi:MAG: hypothetical protein AB2795_21290, partial [Candidatus Thiodiazotropha endolucinida]